MSNLKKQFKKLSENWLLIVLFLLLLVVISGLGSFTFSGQSVKSSQPLIYDMMEGAYSGAGSRDSFVPEEDTRLIIKTTNISLETKKGNYDNIESQIKDILFSVDAIIINENVSESTYGLKSGYYDVRIDTEKQSSVTNQLKNLAKLKHFTESGQDVTGKHTDLSYDYSVEQDILAKYYQIYNEDNLSHNDKINLINKIAYQERKIQSLKDRLSSLEDKISYSTVKVSLQEVSGYANIKFFKISSLVKTLVSSINSLFYILFAVLPYAIAIYLIIVVVKKIKKKSKKKK